MSDNVKDIGVNDFENSVINGSGLVLVDFWAPWCGPCRMVAPVLEELARQFQGKLKVYKVNVDNNGELAMQYQVKGIPTLIMFKDGKIVAQHVGASSKAELEKLINSNL